MSKVGNSIFVEKRADSINIFEVEAARGVKSLDVWFERQGEVKREGER